MAASGQKVTVSAGISRKVQAPDFNDKKFANVEPTTGTVVSSEYSTTAGVSSTMSNRSKEGLSTGGYDRHFNVY
jgi:hypothetical protein